MKYPKDVIPWGIFYLSPFYMPNKCNTKSITGKIKNSQIFVQIHINAVTIPANAADPTVNKNIISVIILFFPLIC